MGEKPIGDGVLALLSAIPNVDIVAIISNKTATNKWWKSNNACRLAKEMNVLFIDSEVRLTDSENKMLSDLNADLIVSAHYPWKIHPDVIASAKQAWNLHMGKLPEYRGWNTMAHAILNKEKFLYVTVHELAIEIDQGNLILEVPILISENETAKSLYEKAVPACVGAFGFVLSSLIANQRLPSAAQIGEPHFYKKNSLKALEENLDFHDLDRADLVLRALWFPPFPLPNIPLGNSRLSVELD